MSSYYKDKTIGYASSNDNGNWYLNIKRINSPDNILSFELINRNSMAEYME